MRTKQLIYSFAAIIMLFCSLCCKNNSAQEKYSDERIKEMLRSFYTSYITENSTFPMNQNKRDSIEKKYCTQNVFKQFREDVEYDIFLKSQMVDPRMLKTLTVRKDSIKNDLYFVSYTYGKNNITVKLQVVKEEEEYKINLVYRDM
jgi:hypothetical protein